MLALVVHFVTIPVMEEPNAKQYLEQSQIDSVKAELEGMTDSPEAFSRLLTTIDRFVRANGTADCEYEAIFTLVNTLDVLQSSQMNYDNLVKTTFPFLSAIGFYDYLLVTGVLNADEVKQIKTGIANPFGRSGGIPTA